MEPLLVAALVIGGLVYLAWQRRSPRPFPPWMTPLLHSPLRRRSFSPEAAAERHGLAPGMRVLEVGPGDGYLTPAAIERISPGGRLVCLDVQPAMLRKLRRALGTRAPALVSASGSQLPFRSQTFDLVFLSHVLGEIPDRAGALAEYARILRPGGTLAVTEGLPDPDFIRCSRLVRMARLAGFVPAEHFGRALHYTQRFRIGEGAA
jgi:ubiquinone/menaquinone biosynthesis C-methylase UbiE